MILYIKLKGNMLDTTLGTQLSLYMSLSLALASLYNNLEQKFMEF